MYVDPVSRGVQARVYANPKFRTCDVPILQDFLISFQD
jgi:hypothetical protein